MLSVTPPHALIHNRQDGETHVSPMDSCPQVIGPAVAHRIEVSVSQTQPEIKTWVTQGTCTETPQTSEMATQYTDTD